MPLQFCCRASWCGRIAFDKPSVYIISLCRHCHPSSLPMSVADVCNGLRQVSVHLMASEGDIDVADAAQGSAGAQQIKRCVDTTVRRQHGVTILASRHSLPACFCIRLPLCVKFRLSGSTVVSMVSWYPRLSACRWVPQCKSEHRTNNLAAINKQPPSTRAACALATRRY